MPPVQTDARPTSSSGQATAGGPWTPHPFAILIASVALSVVAALLVAGITEGPATSLVPAAAPATDGPADAPEPVTAPVISRDASDTGRPVGTRAATTVDLELRTVEREGRLADGASYEYWTFDGTVPGPLLRVRVGDTVNLTLSNDAGSGNIHSVDLHAVNGPGGGAGAMQVAPGDSGSVSFLAMNPGVYVYHCATPHIPTHIAQGMYGLIVVEPAGGLPPVDEEFYVVQGDLYTAEDRGTPGLNTYSFASMTAEAPSYVVFNGAVNALTGDAAMQAEVGDRIRMFVGNGGPNLTSSFHVIGEIFDVVHDEASTDAKANVQTTLVPAGGATWVEFTVDVPGDYLLVDHAITRAVDKGALGILTVTGVDAPDIFDAGS